MCATQSNSYDYDKWRCINPGEWRRSCELRHSDAWGALRHSNDGKWRRCDDYA
jgi:hypothetical protein